MNKKMETATLIDKLQPVHEADDSLLAKKVDDKTDIYFEKDGDMILVYLNILGKLHRGYIREEDVYTLVKWLCDKYDCWNILDNAIDIKSLMDQNSKYKEIIECDIDRMKEISDLLKEAESILRNEANKRKTSIGKRKLGAILRKISKAHQ